MYHKIKKYTKYSVFALQEVEKYQNFHDVDDSKNRPNQKFVTTDIVVLMLPQGGGGRVSGVPRSVELPKSKESFWSKEPLKIIIMPIARVRRIRAQAQHLNNLLMSILILMDEYFDFLKIFGSI